ncbi:DUF1015 domain-containing protein [Acididesulfobacillus acetoxydans]|uniref:DUF1015 domain-containing protein n=1 Tax=Acididesulfobacillus acetoxydans TaxID=1561005 RepID=UPI001F0EFEB7|nr:DUF1015 family protein [Acididesulfobacillus acetoxydans]
MAIVRPFRAVRPRADAAARVAALPYDVFNRQEALAEVRKEPLSFLKIDRAETQFSEDVAPDDSRVYERAGETLREMIRDGVLIRESGDSYYIYELTGAGHTQTGIVACAAVDDYLGNVIKKHENTRADKEADRINHVEACRAQTGPIFLAYRSREAINRAVDRSKGEPPLYDFVAGDGVRHTVWKVKRQSEQDEIRAGFEQVPSVYIADGHHRAAAAVKLALKRRKENPAYSGDEEFNFFLSVLFPHDQLRILPYNRVVRDLGGYSEEEFLRALTGAFEVKELGSAACQPREKATFGLYLGGVWYELRAGEGIRFSDPVEGLAVSLLQSHVLAPLLKITDVRTDRRIDFVGGIRGLPELERRTRTDMKLAFSLYPTSLQELFDVADAGQLMPPKSTWFEPKLRSGLFIHEI